ncbi:hypothetical protein BB561_001993 [Smittium simulii]|uniref:CCHC-type domain-containing protein n=1 Tax=Smittium simulii TaxID=133385 RepID=A0A2T9YS73_9FUNG|nr:hypothetical protein BB561_001993 [Smittium simulii]
MYKKGNNRHLNAQAGKYKRAPIQEIKREDSPPLYATEKYYDVDSSDQESKSNISENEFNCFFLQVMEDAETHLKRPKQPKKIKPEKYITIEDLENNLKNLKVSGGYVRRPPKFSGSWHEDVEEFLKKFETHVASKKNKLTGNRLHEHFLTHLKDEAKRVGGMLSVLYPEWDLFTEKFISRFNNKDRRDKALKELAGLNLYKNEALENFYKLKKIFQALNIYDEEYIASEILEKCSKRDKNNLIARQCFTSRKIMEYFFEEEKRNLYTDSKEYQVEKKEPRNQTYRKSKKYTSMEDSVCYSCGFLGHYARDCEQYF